MAHIDAQLTTGRRVYVRTAYGEPAVAALKGLGAKWDPEAKAWWVGAAKRAAVEELLVGADRAQDEAHERGEPAPKEDPAGVRLVGKARYKGRTYYVRWAGRTRKGTYAMRLVTLDGSRDFWADGLDPADLLSDVRGARERERQAEADGLAVLVKTYSPREYRGRTEYTTLASIRHFIESAKADERARADGTAETRRCWECGGDFTEMDARRNGGDWNDSYCGC